MTGKQSTTSRSYVILTVLSQLVATVQCVYAASFYNCNTAMISPISLAASLGLTGVILTQAQELASTVQGFDISHWQPNVDFQTAYNSGSRFVIIKVCSHYGSPLIIVIRSLL